MDVENWLTLQVGEDGTPEDIPLEHAGGTVRVAVGEPHKRSSIWYIHANRSASDVYIFAATLGGSQKFSLHQSGAWRYAFTSEFMDDEKNVDIVDSLEDRVLDEWERPAGAAVFGPSIRIRARDVADVDDSALRRPSRVVWLPEPPEGHATTIEILVFKPHTPLEMRGYRPIACILLANGEAAMVLTVTRPVESTLDEWIDAQIENAVELMPAVTAARQGEPGLRIGIFGHGADGQRFVWDASFRPPTSELTERGEGEQRA